MPWDIKIDEQDLPVLSVVATEALTLLRNAEATNQELNDLIRQDPSLVSRVLHIANSPFYGGRCQAKKISDAIVRLGFRQLRNVLLMAATGELFDAEDPMVRHLWDHVLMVATTSDQLATTLSIPQEEDAFLAGLLHDIGKFIIYRQYPEPYTRLTEQARAEGLRLFELEDTELVYFNHMSIGGMVVRKWKLPEVIAEITRQHHVLEFEIPQYLENRRLACVVCIANVLVNNAGLGAPVCGIEDVAEMAAAQELGLTLGRLTLLAAQVQANCQARTGAAVDA